MHTNLHKLKSVELHCIALTVDVDEQLNFSRKYFLKFYWRQVHSSFDDEEVVGPCDPGAIAGRQEQTVLVGDRERDRWRMVRVMVQPAVRHTVRLLQPQPTDLHHRHDRKMLLTRDKGVRVEAEVAVQGLHLIVSYSRFVVKQRHAKHLRQQVLR